MKKCIIIPDSFKGTLTAAEVCEIEKSEVKSVFPKCEVKTVPVADGGEGTIDCFSSALKKSLKIPVLTTGPYGEKITAYFLKSGDTAIIESAMCVGLPLVEGKENPELTSTFGLGEVFKAAVKSGCKNILVGLGGSCTNDCGAGLAAALGANFKDNNNKSIIPNGKTLKDVSSIEISKVREFLRGIKITAMCDVENPLFGKNGAAYVFAPQKGADENMVKRLDKSLEKFSETIKKELGIDIKNIRGAGAAGGLGGGIVAFLGGTLEKGIDAVLETVSFSSLLDGADVVFTGEGAIDSQSVGGKVISGVAARAKEKNVPVIAVCGSIGDGAELAYSLGVSAIFSINQKAEDFSVSRYKSKENLKKTMNNILRLLKATESR